MPHASPGPVRPGTPDEPRRAAVPAAPTTPSEVRTVVVVGHTGAGKTTLVEGLLAATGAIPRAGTVADGTTVTDHDPASRRQGRSVSMSVASTWYAGVKVNLVDTPGHPDFVGDLRAGLRAADAALFVVSATAGLDGATALLWDECAVAEVPRAIVVTHLDQPRADFEEAAAICSRVLGEGIVPLYLPLHADDESVAGVVALLTRTVIDHSGGDREVREADPEHVELIAVRRADLIEAVIQESEDDSLMDRYLAGEEVDEETVMRDLHTAVGRGSFHPVLPVAAVRGVGLTEILELVVRGFPSPADRQPPVVTTPDGRPRDLLVCDPDGPLVAEVVKTTPDQFVGRVSLVRVFSGTLRPDTSIHVAGHGPRFDTADAPGPDRPDGRQEHDLVERTGTLSTPLGAILHPTNVCVAGDLCAVTRLAGAETGDTISAPDDPMLIEPWMLPEPLLPVAVRPHSPADDGRLAEALSQLSLEDITVRVQHDETTGQLVLWTMGESHCALVLDRLQERYGVAVDAEPLRLRLRETVTTRADGTGRLVKQSGGHGQYAVCEVRVEPLPAGSGIEFVSAVVGGVVPQHYVPAVEKGVRARAQEGALAGYPLTDLRVTLTGGKAHAVDSSDAAFARAGALALADALPQAAPILLEPVELVVVVADDAYLGAVMSDLSARRGRVTGTDSNGNGRSTVSAEVPAASLARYAVELRSVARGTATFTRTYARHEPVPAHVAARVLAEVAGEHAGARGKRG